MNGIDIDWGAVLQVVLIVSAISLTLATLLGLWIWRSVRRLRIPESASFVEAMRMTPLSVVVFLDLLDLGLDIFAAPVAWIVLSRLGLHKLRGASVVEAVIPGTQAIPTMTVAWFGVRLFGPQLDEIPWLRERVDREAQVRTGQSARGREPAPQVTHDLESPAWGRGDPVPVRPRNRPR